MMGRPKIGGRMRAERRLEGGDVTGVKRGSGERIELGLPGKSVDAQESVLHTKNQLKGMTNVQYCAFQKEQGGVQANVTVSVTGMKERGGAVFLDSVFALPTRERGDVVVTDSGFLWSRERGDAVVSDQVFRGTRERGTRGVVGQSFISDKGGGMRRV